MPLFKNRPLCALSALFLLSVSLSIGTDGAAIPYLAALSVLSFFLIPLLRRAGRPILSRRRAYFALGAALVLLLSLLFSHLAYLRPARALPSGEDEVSVTARVEEVLFESDYAFSCYASLETVNGERAAGRVVVEGDFQVILSRGAEISFRAVIRELDSEDGIYRKADGCAALMECASEPIVLLDEPNVIERLLNALEEWRKTLSFRLSTAVEGESGRLLRAMLLGDRDALTGTTALDFRRLGMSHILSISGLHLQILIFLFTTVLSRLGLRRRWVLTASMAAILFYVALIGFTPSALRAGLMAIFLAISFLVREQSDSVTSLFLTATVITLLSPATIYDIGFHLSCFATFGILLTTELRERKPSPQHPSARLARAVLSSLLITVSATLATLPLTAFCFGEFSLFSPIANLLLTPLFSLYLSLSPLVLLIPLIPLIGPMLSAIGRALLLAVSAVADLPGILLDINYPDFLVLCFLSAAVFTLLLCFARQKRTLALAGGAILTLLVLCISHNTLSLLDRTEIQYQSVTGNEYLLLLDGRQGLLCEATNAASRAAKEAYVFVREAHLCELDSYLLTHYHQSHPRTLAKLFGNVKVGTLYLPTPTSEKEMGIYRECLAVAEEYGVHAARYDTEAALHFNEVTLTPYGIADVKGSTHPSFALTLTDGERTLTYLGAGIARSEIAAEAAEALKRSTHVIFGEHGPKEEGRFAFTHISADLSLVVIAEPEERLHPDALSLLEERGLLLTDRRVTLPLG